MVGACGEAPWLRRSSASTRCPRAASAFWAAPKFCPAPSSPCRKATGRPVPASVMESLMLSPLAARMTLATINAPPSITSQPIGSPSQSALTSTPKAGTSRKPTEETAPGSFRPASMTHQVPIGAAIMPMKSMCGQEPGPMPPPGSSSSATGASTSAPMPKQKGSSSSTGVRGGHLRVAMIAMLHSRPAKISIRWPASTCVSPQSTAQGPISTPAPASPSPAATHRMAETCSPRNSTDIGTSQ
jgi:hypothetical protein